MRGSSPTQRTQVSGSSAPPPRMPTDSSQAESTGRGKKGKNPAKKGGGTRVSKLEPAPPPNIIVPSHEFVIGSAPTHVCTTDCEEQGYARKKGITEKREWAHPGRRQNITVSTKADNSIQIVTVPPD
ncbi:hypothetical protein VTK73DRAFT_8749 [Phialemonium thermophilum]|uniref:Uncharacterized protein n=1 Tax=Phialemonium thermophilum TaxID=223376 RepID=A0ABR3W6S7_9PEZI